MQADDADLVRSLAVVDATIKRSDRLRRRLPALQRRRLRRRVDRRPSVGAVEQGQRPRLAGARRVSAGSGSSARATSPPRVKRRAGDGRDGLRRRADPRAGVGRCPTSPRSPFGTDPTIASIGFQNGKPAGSAAALTWSAAGFVRLMLEPRRRRRARPPGLHVRPLRQAHAGHDGADRHRARRPLGGDRLDHGHRHVARPATRSPSARSTRTTTRRSRARRPCRNSGAFSVPIPLTGGTTVLNIVATEPQRRHRARGPHGRLRLRARHAGVRHRRSGRRRPRARATTPIRRRRTSSPAPTTCSASRSTTRATGSSSASARAT